MANKIVTVDEALRLPPEVEAALKSDLDATFATQVTQAQTAAATATSEADRAQAAAEQATAPADLQVARLIEDDTSEVHSALTAFFGDRGSITPSGDTSGATDLSVINAALQSGHTSLTGGVFHINGSITIPSNRTLLLRDCEIRLAAGTNQPVIRNQNIVTRTDPNADQNIAVIGMGRVFINGNGQQQTNQGDTVNYWLNQGVVFCGVTNLRVQGLKINANKGAMQLIGCAHVRGGEIEFDQNTGSVNQDGLDIGPDSFDIHLSGFTGECEDDPFSFFAKGTAWMIPPGTYRMSEGGPGGSIRDVLITDVNVRAVNENCIRLQAADGHTMERVKFNGVISRGTGNLVHLGPTSYSTTPPTAYQFRDISIENVTHGGTMLRVSSPCQGISVRNVQLRTGSATRRVVLFLSSFATDVRDINISDIQAMVDDQNVGSWTVFESHASATANTVLFDDVYVERGIITANAGNTGGIRFNDITVRTATGPVFSSTNPEANGSATNVKVQTLGAGVTSRYAYSCNLQLDNAPSFQDTDTLPNPISGSKPFIRWRALADISPADWTSNTRAHTNSGQGTVNVDLVRSSTAGSGDVTVGTLPGPMRPSEDTYGLWVNQQTGVAGLMVAYANGDVRLIGTSANPGQRIRSSLTYPLP